MLTWWWGIRYGATGAGAAFCLVMIAMTLAFLLISNRKFQHLIAGPSGTNTE